MDNYGLVPPCLYRSDGSLREIAPIGGTLRHSQITQALGGAYQVIDFGDNCVAIVNDTSKCDYNPIVSMLIQSPAYGPVIFGHRSFFSGGA